MGSYMSTQSTLEQGYELEDLSQKEQLFQAADKAIEASKEVFGDIENKKKKADEDVSLLAQQIFHSPSTSLDMALSRLDDFLNETNSSINPAMHNAATQVYNAIIQEVYGKSVKLSPEQEQTVIQLVDTTRLLAANPTNVKLHADYNDSINKINELKSSGPKLERVVSTAMMVLGVALIATALAVGIGFGIATGGAGFAFEAAGIFAGVAGNFGALSTAFGWIMRPTQPSGTKLPKVAETAGTFFSKVETVNAPVEENTDTLTSLAAN
ncbi:MAG: hypothetical protein Tsb005_00460 [Gammaproteobacteria bacterium]